jgi:hypothetical protein
MINSLKKLGIITIVLMFLATSITVVSAKNYTVVSKSSGEPVTEYFKLCYIEYEDEGFSIGMCNSIGKHAFWWTWIDCWHGNVTIKSPKKTLTVEGNFDLSINKEHPIMKSLFNQSIPFITFVGKFNLPLSFTSGGMHPDYSFKGIARGVEITYYP